MTDHGRSSASPEEAVESVNRLGTFINDEVTSHLPTVDPTPLRTLLLAFLMRGIETYNAMGVLGKHGFGEQAAMLNRSLFEQMLDAHWLAENEEHGIELMGEHETLTRAEFAASSKRHPAVFPAPKEDADLPSAAEIARLRTKFAKGGMSWTARRLRDRLAEVKKRWPGGGEDLSLFADLPHKVDNLWLHPSPFALQASIATEDGKTSLGHGPGGFFVPQALFAGTWSIGQLVTLVLQRCGFPEQSSERFEKKAWGPALASFIHLSSEEAKGVGRNDPCPCESGLKFKYCHGG